MRKEFGVSCDAQYQIQHERKIQRHISQTSLLRFIFREKLNISPRQPEELPHNRFLVQHDSSSSSKPARASFRTHHEPFSCKYIILVMVSAFPFNDDAEIHQLYFRGVRTIRTLHNRKCVTAGQELECHHRGPFEVYITPHHIPLNRKSRSSMSNIASSILPGLRYRSSISFSWI